MTVLMFTTVAVTITITIIVDIPATLLSLVLLLSLFRTLYLLGYIAEARGLLAILVLVLELPNLPADAIFHLARARGRQTPAWTTFTNMYVCI